MAVGDINSSEPGSGARYNDGKLPYELLLFKFYPTTDWMPSNFFAQLHQYQMTGDIVHIKFAYEIFMNLCINWSDSNFMDKVVGVWEFGMKKYKQFNWAKGQRWTVPLACIGRHYSKGMFADNDPNSIDDESGLPHWAHIMCNLQMLLQFNETYQAGNDLPYRFINGEIEEVDGEIVDCEQVCIKKELDIFAGDSNE